MALIELIYKAKAEKEFPKEDSAKYVFTKMSDAKVEVLNNIINEFKRNLNLSTLLIGHKKRLAFLNELLNFVNDSEYEEVRDLASKIKSDITKYDRKEITFRMAVERLLEYAEEIKKYIDRRISEDSFEEEKQIYAFACFCKNPTDFYNMSNEELEQFEKDLQELKGKEIIAKAKEDFPKFDLAVNFNNVRKEDKRMFMNMVNSNLYTEEQKKLFLKDLINKTFNQAKKGEKNVNFIKPEETRVKEFVDLYEEHKSEIEKGDIFEKETARINKGLVERAYKSAKLDRIDDFNKDQWYNIYEGLLATITGKDVDKSEIIKEYEQELEGFIKIYNKVKNSALDHYKKDAKKTDKLKLTFNASDLKAKLKSVSDPEEFKRKIDPVVKECEKLLEEAKKYKDDYEKILDCSKKLNEAFAKYK